MIRLLAPAALVACALLACGARPLTPKTACEEQSDPACEKMWNCAMSNVKIGSDLATCKSQFKSLCALAGDTCADMKTFDATAAAACAPAIKASTCETYFSKDAGEPISCKTQCK